MSDKPTKLPRWNTDLTNQTEPTELKKDAGWTAVEKPISSSFFNWLLYFTGAWLTWLDDRVTNTGGTAPRMGFRGIGSTGEADGTGGTFVGQGVADGVTATGGATGKGIRGVGGGGNTVGVQGQGSGTGVGVDGTGGATSGVGVRGVGGAPNGVGVRGEGTGNANGVRGVGGPTNGVGVNGTGGGTGDGVNGNSTGGHGVAGFANSGSFSGVQGTSPIGGGYGVSGIGSTTGTGVAGTSTDGIGVWGQSDNGHGLQAQGDLTTPLKSAFRIVPQDAEPSSAPEKGDIYVDSVLNEVRHHDGTAWRTLSQTIPKSRTATGAVATGTTLLPYDDTIPQITEGIEFITVAHTPKKIGNKLKVSAHLSLANSVGTAHMSVAIFKDAVANALAAAAQHYITVNSSSQLIVEYEEIVASLSAATWRVRAGSNQAGTTTFNGNSAARIFGGVMESFIQVEEIPQ